MVTGGCEAETEPCEGAGCADAAVGQGQDTEPQEPVQSADAGVGPGQDTEAPEPVQSAEAQAVCEVKDPLIGTDPTTEYFFAQIFLLDLEEVAKEHVESPESYLATVAAVDGVADVEFPMAVCPLSFAFTGVRCELWAGGIAAFDYNEVVVARDYEPCAFSDVPPGSHDVKIELCCFGDCGMLDTCGFGEVWVNVVVE